MDFFTNAIDVLQTLVIALAAACACGAASTFWKVTGRITLHPNPRASSSSWPAVVSPLIGLTLVPCCPGCSPLMSASRPHGRPRPHGASRQRR